jgi:hypothetical protein
MNILEHSHYVLLLFSINIMLFLLNIKLQKEHYVFIRNLRSSLKERNNVSHLHKNWQTTQPNSFSINIKRNMHILNMIM